MIDGQGPDTQAEREVFEHDNSAWADIDAYGRWADRGEPPGLRSGDWAGVPPGPGSFALHGGMVDVLSSGREGPEGALALQYSRARYFDLTHGRFLQRDPTGYADGSNLYEAFGSNPARFRDPMGTALGDWWDPCTYTTTFGEALDDVIFIPLSEAIAAVNLENETTPTFVGDVLIILHELPARAVVSREATLAASHKRDVDCGFLHITRLWAGHHSGANSMWDGMVGYDWYSGREIHGVERVSTFSGGLSAAAGWGAMGASTAPALSSTARAATLRGLQWGARVNLPVPRAFQPALRSFGFRLALNEGAHQFALKTPQAAAQAGLAWSRGGTGLTSAIGFSDDAARVGTAVAPSLRRSFRLSTISKRIEDVAQRGYNYAVDHPREFGLSRLRLGKDAEVQATRWLRQWARRNDVPMGPEGLEFQLRGAHSVPDVVFHPSRDIFDFKLTIDAIRPEQTQNFISDFPGYRLRYIYGPDQWR